MYGPHRVCWPLVALVISLSSAAPAEPQQSLPAQAKPPVDLFGDPLPPGTLARMGTIRLRPGAPPAHLVFSPDSNQLYCFAGGHGSADALVQYDVASGTELR